MRRLLASIAAGALLVALFAPGVSATTTRYPFSGTGTFSKEISPGVTTMTGTVVSVRGMVWEYVNAVGDARVDGPDLVVINYDLDLVTGLGALWGTDTPRPIAYPDGGFTCHYYGEWAGGMPPFWTGKDVCHGFGSLDGWQLRYNMGTNPAITGYLFKPGE